MAFNYCDTADLSRIRSSFTNDNNDDIILLYKYICPILLIVCVTSIILNSLLINISRQSRFVGRKSSILLLSLNLAITDVIASLLNTVSILFNSWLYVVYGLSMNGCVMLTLETIRIAAIMSSALHLLALAFAHYGSIAWPIQYRSFILLPSKTINIISIFCWTISLTITISSFLVTECQGFTTFFEKLECNADFTLSFNFRYILFVVFFTPLVLMSIIYARIFIIISEHQRKRRIEHERSISLAGPTGAALSVAVHLSELDSRSPAPSSGGGGGELCPVCTIKTQMRNENDYDQDDDEFSSSSDASDSDNRSDDDDERRRHAHFSEESGAGGGGSGSIGSRRLKYKLSGCGEETKSGGASVIFEDERSHDSAAAAAAAAAATCATSATDRRPSTGQSYSCSNSTIIYKDPTGSEDLPPIVASLASSGSSGLRNDDDNVFVSSTARSPNEQFRPVESKNLCDSNNNGNHNSLFLSSNNDDNRKSRAVETIVRPANSVGSGKFETTYYDNKGQQEAQQQHHHHHQPRAHDEGIVFILNDTTGSGSGSNSSSSGSTSRGAPESNPAAAAAAVLTPTPFMKLKQGADTTKETPNQGNSDCRSSGSGGDGGGDGGRGISGQVSLVDHASAASDNVDYSIRRGTREIASIVARHQSRECELQGAQNNGQMGYSVGSGSGDGEGCAGEEEEEEEEVEERRHLNRRISRESLLKAKQSVVVIGGGGGGQVSETNKPNQKDSQWCRTSAMSAPPLCENNNNNDGDDHENEARIDHNNFQNGASDKQKQQRKRSSCSKRGSLDKGEQNHFATTSGAGYASGKCAPPTVDARVDQQAIQIGRPHKRASKRKHSNATSRSSDNNTTDNLLLKKCTCDNKLKQSSMKLSRANTIGFTGGGEQRIALAKSTSTATQPKAQPTTTTTTSSSVVGQCRSRPARPVVTKCSVETGSSSILSAGCNATAPLKLQPSVQANYFTSITEQDQQQQKSNTTIASSTTFTTKTTTTATTTTTTPTSTTPLRTNSNSLTTGPLDQTTTSAFATSSCAMKAAPATTAATMTVTMATALPSSNKTINKTASTMAIAARQSGSGCHELQRVNVHPSAEPHTNTKAAMTTFYILGTYFACYAPSTILAVLTCIDDSRCPYSILEFTPAKRTLVGALTFMLLIIKTIIDPLIYTYRMNEIKEGISRYLSSRRSRKSSAQHAVSMNTSQRFGANSHTSGGGGGAGGGGNSMYSNRSNNCSQANSSSFRLLTGRSGAASTNSAIRSSATSNPSRHTNQRLSRQTTTTTMTSSSLKDDHPLLRQHQSKPLIVNIYTNDGSLNSSSNSSKPNGSINAIDNKQQNEQLTKIVAGTGNESEKNNSIDQINENDRLLIEIGSSIEDDKSDSAVLITMINEFARPLSTKVATAIAAGVNLLDEDNSVAAGMGKFANKESCSSGKIIPVIDHENSGPKCSPMAHKTIDKSSSPISSSFSGPIQSSSGDFKLDTSNLVC